MQAAAENLRESLWAKLKTVYTNYATTEAQIKTSVIQELIVDVLQEESQAEKDYVMKNMFRLDSDGSGSVSFIELGNFLFKRHCGEMSLQRNHRNGKMSHGKDREMTLEEFNKLLNESYTFLKVSCPADVAQFIFKNTDTNEDGLITYVQYFQVIEKYVCKDPNYKIPKSEEKPKEVPANLGPARNSKLRRYIWESLRKLYDAHVQGRTLAANDVEIRNLLFSIVGELNENELSFLSSGLLKLNYKVITFEEFVIHFIFLIAELGLSRFSSNNSSSKKTLNRDEFVILLKNTFSFIKLGAFKNSILWKIFAKIDKNNDGLISYDEYLDWVKRFLAVLNYYGDEFWVEEDDEDKDNSDPFEKPPMDVKPKNYIQFSFSDYTFAKQVRLRVYELLVEFDFDKNEEFSREEIQAALIKLFKENQYELDYVTRNVFRYDRDGDNSVTYDQLTNFCVEQHFGEMAIQRLHKKKFYSKGAERIMSKQEFGKTLNYALEAINIVANQAILDLLFKEIDLDNDGWIPYEVYFMFLKYYFGSLSLGRLDTLSVKKNTSAPVLSEDQKWLLSLANLNAFDRFVRIIIDQLRKIFYNYDYNKNMIFESDEISDILQKVFSLDENDIDYILFNFFNFDKSSTKGVTFEELIFIILNIYFIELLFKKKYQSGSATVWTSKKISLEEFISLIIDACFFIKIKPTREDLVWIFEQLDTDHDGFITFQQYSDFIKKYLGNNIDLVAKPKPVTDPNGISPEELAFIGALWDELKKYFDKYDKGTKGFLNGEELKLFVMEVLNETSQRELDYVFWNIFRADPNANKEFDFFEFAPYILNHAGEIALQRYHRNQEKGKSSLKEEELYIVLNNGYGFLVSIPKQKVAINKIFTRIQTNGTVGYAGFLGWIHRNLSAKYTK